MSFKKISIEYKIALFSLLIAFITLITNVYFNYLNSENQLKLKEYELTHLEKKKIFSNIMNVLYDYNSIKEQINFSYENVESNKLKDSLLLKQREYQKYLYELYPLLEKKSMQDFRLRSVKILDEMEILNRLNGKRTFLSNRINKNEFISDSILENDSIQKIKFNASFQDDLVDYYVYMRDTLYPNTFTYYK